MAATPIVTTALWYHSGAEEAATRYCSLFAEARITSVFRQQGDPQGRAFLVNFTLQGQRFQAMNGGPHYTLNPACSISVTVDGQAEVDRLWDALLADGGTESRCGWLADRWGLSWQILPRRMLELMQGNRAAEVTQAMMRMVRIDVAALEAAASGT